MSTPHGFQDDVRARLLRTRPPPRALAWVETNIGGHVTGVRALRGGRSSAMHAVRLQTSTTVETVVLRRYVRAEVVAETPDVAHREARALRLLERSEVLAPVPLALDGDGAEVGVPAVLMSRMPGRLDWDLQDIERCAAQLAAPLPALHAVPVEPAVAVAEFCPYPPHQWPPPAWMRDPGLWDRAIDLFHGPRLDTERVLIHRDYHPGNVLWRRGKVSGIVDWQDTSIGPGSVDVAWCRLNLLGRRIRLDTTDRLIAHWECLTGQRFHPWAEVVLLVDRLSWPSLPSAQEREDLERLLARSLSLLQ